MKIYNTLTREKEDFKTIEDNKVKMYVCGPTVYNYIHIGNARPVVFFDTIRRYLEYKGYKVEFVMNFTDVDDKIINKAIDEGVDFKEISEKYTQIFKKNISDLNVDDSKIIHPKATEFIGPMIKFIKELEKIDAAYDTEDTVYFSVDKAKNYGKLSKKNIDDLIAGARVEIGQNKKNPMDFALWKKKKFENEPSWNSPWGEGRPGWHIECSVMAKSKLGETIDIHGGGEDLQFPHHENEIAQSETLHNHPFANYWMHNAMITINHTKMSKSLNNFFTINDIQKKYDLKYVRMWLLSSHYRSPIDFSEENILAIKNSYERLYNSYENMQRLKKSTISKSLTKSLEIDKFMNDFDNAMDDDFNTSKAMSYIFELSKYFNTNFDENSSLEDVEYIIFTFKNMVDILGLDFEIKDEELEYEIQNLILERNEARKNKDFKKSDEIRDYLKQKGIELKDTPNGVVWKKI